MRSRIDGVQPSQPASEQLPVYDGVIQIPAEIPAQAAVVESATAAITSQEQQLPQPHTPPNYPEENASDQLVSLNPGGADGAVDGDDNFVLVGVDNPILTATTTTDITTTTTTAPPCDPPPQYF